MSEFGIKGVAERLPSGVNREPEDDKLDYTLLRDGPMFKRWASHLTRAIPVRGRRNWMNADSSDDLARFRRSASRHFEQWLDGEDDEDHASAVLFNINGAEYLLEKGVSLESPSEDPTAQDAGQSSSKSDIGEFVQYTIEHGWTKRAVLDIDQAHERKQSVSFCSTEEIPHGMV